PSGFGVFLNANEDDTCDVFTGGRKMRVNVSPNVELAELRPGQEVVLNEALQDAGLQQRAGDADRLADVLELPLAWLVVVREQPPHGEERVPGPVDDVEDHRRRHPHVAGQRLGVGVDQPLLSRLAPRHHAVGDLLAHQLATLLRVVGDLRELLEVLHLVLRRLDDDGPRGVEAGAARPPGDLVELTGVEQPGAGAVVLGQRGEDDGADRHVDADPEGVGAADNLEQAGLGELLHQPSVLRQHPGVVDADPVPDQSGQRRPEGGGEPEPTDHLGDRGLLLLGAHVDAHQRLRPLEGRGLREVDDVDRRLSGVQQLLDRLVHRRRRVVVVQRHRALGRGHQRRRPARPAGEVLPQERDVTEGRRHQQELRRRQLQQRHLPGPAAVGVAVEVELVHDHQRLAQAVRSTPLAQRDVGQHLGGAGDDRGPGVDAGVAGQHPDVGRPEDAAEREELLAHQRLDRCRVVAAPSAGQCGVLRAGRDE
ncbi:MAG: hypothetical protein JF630_13630, partial [Geodermatophilales bacterium]|nr:hypothetical protein [Geodermatophilales bacterium]